MKLFGFKTSAASVAVLALALAGSAAAQAPSVDDLVKKNLDAKGGKEKIEAVKSARVKGTMSMMGMEAPFVWEWKAPNKLRMEFTMQGMTGVQAYDGAAGWMHMPFMGKSEPEKMAAEDAKQLADQADFGGPFINTKDKGYTLEYLGEGEADGTPCHKIKVTKEGGDTSIIFLDKDNWLEIKQESKAKVRGQDMESNTDIGDYKEVGGLMLAHSYQMSSPANPGAQQSLTFNEVELNAEIADSRFEMPAVKPAAEAKKEGGTAQ